MTLPAFFLDPRRHCKGSLLMWPEDTKGVAVAIAICQPPGKKPCPFVEECLQYALEHHEEHGVWGGRSMRARGRIRSRPEHGTVAGYGWHRRHREQPCDACRTAHNAWKVDNNDKHPCRKVRAYPNVDAVPIRSDTTPYECHVCGQWHATTKRRAA